MKTVRRTGTIVMTAMFSLLLVAGCSDEESEPRAKTRPAAETLPVAEAESAKGLSLVLGDGVTMKLVRIEAGEFMMGSKLSPEDVAKRFVSKAKIKFSVSSAIGWLSDEHPRHQVAIGSQFYMGVTEVTQAQWEAVMNTRPWQDEGGYFVKSSANNAASWISWDDATAFCIALSKKAGRTVRLPTEAEWEYACRADTRTLYSFGDDPSKVGDYAWCYGNASDKGEEYAHSVGVKKPNAWDLYDMHGNVWEWCSDWYADSYASMDALDPKGPATGTERVQRGGSWDYESVRCRAADRSSYPPDRRIDDFGFRVVVEIGSGGTDQ